MTRTDHPFGTCPACGKRRYPDADTAARAAGAHPSEHLQAYPCRGGYWHIGHPPRSHRRTQMRRRIR